LISTKRRSRLRTPFRLPIRFQWSSRNHLPAVVAVMPRFSRIMQGRDTKLGTRLFGLHILITAWAAGRRYNFEPTSSWWRYLHVAIQSSRGTDNSVGLRQLVAQRGRTCAPSDCRRIAPDIRRTCSARLWCYPPLACRLCQCRAGNRHTRDNRNEQQSHGQLSLWPLFC
jgi:hypothetical protein